MLRNNANRVLYQGHSAVFWQFGAKKTSYQIRVKVEISKISIKLAT